MTGTEFSKLVFIHSHRDPQWVAGLRSLVSDLDSVAASAMQVIALTETDGEEFAVKACLALFAINPSGESGSDFGATAKTLLNKISKSGDPHGVNKRVREILDGATDEMLLHNLLWFARMGKMHGVWMGWADLFDGLAAWNADGKPTQRRWAGSFWMR